ncbi:glycosyltransferase family 2 protein [Providencia sp. PROV266]|uniref:glycosyltransferase family 2 protein n=1 Tax=Providencia sp. PROV266 TaxID=2949954 RepID=UPI00234A7398|nr:glycosyltransferase family 2 protein [Providencia sp. PROV266]
MNSKISVIIPLYNGESVILRALKSILNQTVEVDEVIIINDGSTDNSASIIKDYIIKERISNIHLIEKENGGVSSARNLGILKAKNELIAFLDCDDEWIPNKIEMQLKYIQSDDIILVGGNHFISPLSYIGFKKAKNINIITLNNLLFKNYFQPSTVITKRSIALKINSFNEQQRYAEEGQFFYKLSQYGKLVHINEQLVIYDGGEKSGFGHSGLSKNIFEMEKGELKNINFAYKHLNISPISYFFAISFSILKYFRRLFIKKLSTLRN